MHKKRDFYIPLGSTNLSKPEKSNWYIVAGGKGVLLIVPVEEHSNNSPKKFRLRRYVH